MKTTIKDLKPLLAQANRPKAYLAYGTDQGRVQAVVEDISRALGGEILRQSQDYCKQDDISLSDKLSSPSLLGDVSTYVVTDATDACTAFVKELKPEHLANNIVIRAGNLAARSSLRKWAEAAPFVSCIACYQEEGRNRYSAIEQWLRDHHCTAEREAISQLSQILPPDFAMMQRELEKLALYTDGQTITATHVDALFTDHSDEAFDHLLDAIWRGDVVQTERRYARLMARQWSSGQVMRFLAMHIHKMLGLSTQIASGQTIEQAMQRSRPPIFFKQKPLISAQLRQWGAPHWKEWAIWMHDAEAQARLNSAMDSFTARRVLQLANMVRSKR